MKMTTLMTSELPAIAQASAMVTALPELTEAGHRPSNVVRHILLGSPEAVQQTIHLLHTRHYAETTLWSPVMTVTEPLMITPAQGEAMSLLRRTV